MSYKVRAVCNFCKLDVEGKSDIFHHVDPNPFDFRLSVEAVFPPDVTDDGVRLRDLDVTWVF